MKRIWSAVEGNGQAAATSSPSPRRSQPLTTTPLAPIVVDIEDSNGNLITGDNSNVTLAIATPSGGTLGGQHRGSRRRRGNVQRHYHHDRGSNYSLTATDGASRRNLYFFTVRQRWWRAAMGRLIRNHQRHGSHQRHRRSQNSTAS